MLYLREKRPLCKGLVKHLQVVTEYSAKNEEVESYFSEQKDPTDEIVLALENSFDD